MTREDYREDKRVYLQMIQGVVSRMGNNLFYLRGWSITIIMGALAFLSQININHNLIFLLIIIGIITLLFWIYDGYFLALERRYRNLYNDICKKTDEIDFSMDVNKYSKVIDNKAIWCMFSKTICPFYALLLTATIYLIILAR